METMVEERPNYLQIMNRMLVSPGQFFRDTLGYVDLRRALGFLILSSLFFTLAKLSLIQQDYLKLSVINFLNSLFMPALCAGIGYALLKWFSDREIRFNRLFAVYALSSGLMMLMSWIPLFLWITEPWKWFLVGLGLVKGCGLSRRQTLLVIILSIFLIVLVFWSINKIIFLLR